MSWISDERIGKYGYKLIRVGEHPFLDKAGFILEHRFVAEQYLLDDKNSININGKLYLNPEYVVHHIDFNRINNKKENLYIFENMSKHTLYHNLYGQKINSIEEFEEYYKDKYINKILNYEWLYTAYVLYGLSVNKISKYFNIPYKSTEKQVFIFNLKKEKEENLYNPIINYLENFNTKEINKLMNNNKIRGFEVCKGFEDKEINLPKRSTANSAGYDFECAEDIVIKKMCWYGNLLSERKPTLVSTGIKSYMLNNEALFLYNRSSNPMKKGLVLANSVGVVDSDYYSNPDNDGHIMFAFYNFSSDDIIIKKGDKIGQGIFKTFLYADDDNAEGERIGGYGSTDK